MYGLKQNEKPPQKQTSHVAPHFSCLGLLHIGMLLIISKHHVVPMAVPIASSVQKSHISLNFDHLDLMNPVVILTMSLMSCAANASANDMTCPKMFC